MNSLATVADRNCPTILLVGLLLALPGCAPNAQIMLHQPFAPRAEIVLRQPFAPPSQQELKLASNSAFDTVADDRRIWLLAFPLPSQPDGPRDFHVYLSTPDGVDDFAADQGSQTAVRGFLIQEVGQLRGKTVVTGGRVRVSKPWYDPRRCVLDLNLACSDGTVIIGHARAEPVASEISAFERRYSGDVLALTAQENARDLAADHAPDQTRATP
jgi:hypothetical protein